MHEKPTQPDSENQTLCEEPTAGASSKAHSETEKAPTKSVQIQTLNDLFRTTFTGGQVVFTSGVHHLEKEVVQAIVSKVQSFSTFTKDNDPYGEHDFGIIQHEGDTFYWKIDYYDKAMIAGSENPADPEVTTRVLTIMHRSEY